MKSIQLIFLSFLFLGLGACSAEKTEAPAKSPATQPAAPQKEKAEAKKPLAPPPKGGVHFINLKDGAELGTEAKLSFAVMGKKVRPAGEDPEDKATGHHHVIVDGAAMAEGAVIPMNETHKHYGKGQTEATLKLAPGPHTLTLQFADGAHRSYGPAWSQSIKVTVKEGAPAAAAPPAAAPPAAAPPAAAPAKAPAAPAAKGK